MGELQAERKTCLEEGQTKGMRKYACMCVFACECVCDRVFIYRSPLGEKCHYSAKVENLVGLC